jgi:hypothetical protein
MTVLAVKGGCRSLLGSGKLLQAVVGLTMAHMFVQAFISLSGVFVHIYKGVRHTDRVDFTVSWALIGSQLSIWLKALVTLAHPVQQ